MVQLFGSLHISSLKLKDFNENLLLEGGHTLKDVKLIGSYHYNIISTLHEPQSKLYQLKDGSSYKSICV
jgi:hypothetical protein